MEVYRCKAHLTNLRIWAIAQRVLTNWSNARHLANCAAHLPKCAAHLVNPTDSDQMCTQFVKCARIWKIFSE